MISSLEPFELKKMGLRKRNSMSEHWFCGVSSVNMEKSCKNGAKMRILKRIVLVILILAFSQPASTAESVSVYKCSSDVGSVVRIPSNWTKLGQPLEFR